MAHSPEDQPYNIILAGPFHVGKSTIFNKLSSDVHADFQYTTINCAQRVKFDKWSHTALVDGSKIKVGHVASI